MTLTQSYEEKRDLLTSMQYHRGNTLVTQRDYSYDALGRPLTRITARQGKAVNDNFIHNTRSELTKAQVNGKEYEYYYDNIGNRLTATEAEAATNYATNELNQYTSIQENEDATFSPLFDEDGNQTRIKTETGIWDVVYNAENRPVSFSNSESDTVIECAYDYMGRRCFKKVTVNGTVTLHQRYIYRGYLQIACCDLTRNNHPALWYITWDPTQRVATRPLSIQKNGTWYTYGWDLTKNVLEVFGASGYIRSTYSYSPSGKVIANGDIEQPLQWSCEFAEDELGLIYYNYRYYNPYTGNWISRDILDEENNINRYQFCNGISEYDVLGLSVSSKIARFLIYRTLLRNVGQQGRKKLVEQIRYYKNIRSLFQIHHLCPKSIIRDILKNRGLNVDSIINLIALPNKEGKKLLEDWVKKGLLDKKILELPIHQGRSRWHRAAEDYLRKILGKNYTYESLCKAMRDFLASDTVKKLMVGAFGFFGISYSQASEMEACCDNREEILNALDKYISELEDYEQKLASYELKIDELEEAANSMRKYTVDFVYLSSYWDNDFTRIFDEFFHPAGLVDLSIDLGMLPHIPSPPSAPEMPETLKCVLSQN